MNILLDRLFVSSELMHQNIDGVLGIIRIFLQNLCARVPDKVDYRTKVSQVTFPTFGEVLLAYL